MIGNDIVDLIQCKAESNWQRKGWLHKLFSEQEIACIEQSRSPETTVWLYWSMKEAAYKIYNRMSGKANFAPSKFICNNNSWTENKVEGYVKFNNETYFTQSNISKDYIHSVAKIDPFQSIQCLISIDLKNIDMPCHYSLHKDNNGLPYLLNNSTGVTHIASKSHHGRFQALVY